MAWAALIFAACYHLPLGNARFDGAVMEALHLLQWYAREHVLLCLVPALFIAGAVSVFVSQASVMKYLGANAPKPLAYGVASVSGSVLAVCSCTVLPLFSGIYRMGAGLGPATAFLYAGPAVNVLAIVLTARILGFQLGLARALGAIVFSVVIGLAMHFLFRKEEREKAAPAAALPDPEVTRPLWKNALYFASMVAILIFANWAAPAQQQGIWWFLYATKWPLTALAALALGLILVLWFTVAWWKVVGVATATALAAWSAPGTPLLPFSIGVLGLILITNTQSGEMEDWLTATFDFAKQILPLLFAGVLIAGLLLGRPEEEGLIPSGWIESLVGGNSLRANLFASVVGAFMYFATLTEVPIVEGLVGSGMGQGPALALLLAGPALSLPNMLVIRSVLGTKKTIAYTLLVVVMATISGILFGLVSTP